MNTIVFRLFSVALIISIISCNSERENPPNKNLFNDKVLYKETYNFGLNAINSILADQSKNLPLDVRTRNKKYPELVQKYISGNNYNCEFEETELEKIFSPDLLNSSVSYFSSAECFGKILNKLIVDKKFFLIRKIISVINLDVETQNKNQESILYDDYNLLRIASLAYFTISKLENIEPEIDTDHELSIKKQYFLNKIKRYVSRINQITNPSGQNRNCILYWALSPVINRVPDFNNYNRSLEEYFSNLYLGVNGQTQTYNEDLLNISYCFQAHLDAQDPIGQVSLDPEETSIIHKIVTWNKSENGLADCNKSKGFINSYNASITNYRHNETYCERFPPTFLLNYRMKMVLDKGIPYS